MPHHLLTYFRVRKILKITTEEAALNITSEAFFTFKELLESEVFKELFEPDVFKELL